MIIKWRIWLSLISLPCSHTPAVSLCISPRPSCHKRKWLFGWIKHTARRYNVMLLWLRYFVLQYIVVNAQTLWCRHCSPQHKTAQANKRHHNLQVLYLIHKLPATINDSEELTCIHLHIAIWLSESLWSKK